MGPDFAAKVDACVERWRAAGPDARKKAVELFAVAGIFITLCRHGHVLVMCDMIRSGELMKYPIANTNYIIDTYGPDIGGAYDIMCKFMKTLLRSSITEKVRNSRFIGVVPAFHGHAHSRDCQVYWHPRYVDGVGMEDFKECERFYAGSNELAATTRTCSPFHRRQQILDYLDFHDIDKYTNHGKFLFHNYRAALQRIEDNKLQLAMLEKQLHTSGEDYERYLQEERTYLDGLKKEPPETAQRFEYMEALDKLRKAEYVIIFALHNNCSPLGADLNLRVLV
ncbi:hypothetical protein FISHEDRAFT_43570 [Fistulina hepatica ATCC 64428]|uniref:Uncharacterized protein n=1 Tax=Fistulina hepatica ATCC 64428 TaxID=1128425 RepID=A0A0D7AC71_9AGAR|nr:hypothetical protein FISHEDRAFT_43570 [Fistulina hepatica ATCC 64428]